MKTLDQIELEITKLHDILEEKDSKWDYSKSYDEYQKYIEPEISKLDELDRLKRMLKPVELSDLPDYGDVMTLESFIENVKDGGFIDYDGFGYYVKDNKETNIKIYPSDVESGSIRTEFSHIIWFNK